MRKHAFASRNTEQVITVFFVCFRKQVAASRADADRDGVVVPITMEEYCMKAKPPMSPQVCQLQSETPELRFTKLYYRSFFYPFPIKTMIAEVWYRKLNNTRVLCWVFIGVKLAYVQCYKTIMFGRVTHARCRWKAKALSVYWDWTRILFHTLAASL